MTDAVVAASYGGPEVLEVRDVEVPPPGSGEVTIDVRGAGVNPYDYKLYSGMLGSDEDRLPMRLGSEVSGVVTAVGEDATGPAGPVEVGDEVIGYPVSGGYAASLTVSATSVFPKPKALSFEQAAGLSLVGVTAYHLLEATGVGPGDTVLIHGVSGGVAGDGPGRQGDRHGGSPSPRDAPRDGHHAGGVRRRAGRPGPRARDGRCGRRPGHGRHRRGRRQLARAGRGP